MSKPSKSELHEALKELVENLSGGVVVGFERALSKSNYLRLVRNKEGMLSDIGRGVSIPEKLVRKSLSVSGIDVEKPIGVLVLSPILMTEVSLPKGMYNYTYNVSGNFAEIGVSFFGRMPEVFHMPGKYIEVGDPGNYGCIQPVMDAYVKYIRSKLDVGFVNMLEDRREGSYYKVKMLDTHCGKGEELCVLEMHFMRSPDNLPVVNYVRYGEDPGVDKCLERIVAYIERFDPVECVYLLPGSSRKLDVYEDDNGGRHVIVYYNI